MKIHNYGNDYVQANKFKKESVNNVKNQTADNRPKSLEPLSADTTDKTEAITETKEGRQSRKKKQAD